jgi:serine protease AprX
VVKTADSSSCTNLGDCLVNTYNTNVRANMLWSKRSDDFVENTLPLVKGKGVGVAILDSGINKNHPDFTARVAAEVKFNSTTAGATDNYGHGTHVAGIIGSNGSASGGAYAGIAPRVKLVNVKVTDDNGMAYSSDVVAGMQWILNNRTAYNIKVVNISMNSAVSQSYHVDPLCAAAEILWFNKIVVVVSAGNNGTSSLHPPANDPFVITVGAVDDKATTKNSWGEYSLSDDVVASFSAYGVDETGTKKPDLVAPGTRIISSMTTGSAKLSASHPHFKLNTNTNYFIMSGTSVAAPVVTGAVALLLQNEPNLTPDQVKYRLKNTAVQNVSRDWWDYRPTWSGYNSTKAGAGYLDIQAAVYQRYYVNGSANTGKQVSQMLTGGSQPVNWGSVNWNSVNWNSVNWNSVNWNSVNWNSVNWNSTYWDD